MSRKYYTLVLREDGRGWGPEFGDYQRSVVADEVRYGYAQTHKARDRKIICTDDTQAAIDAAVARLNA